MNNKLKEVDVFSRDMMNIFERETSDNKKSIG